jgi:predicted ribosome quality control (RQC) complex YloA/Tae2 family protein
MLMRRAAAELEKALRGGRVMDAGLLDDGRFALRIGALRGRPPVTLAVDAFGSPALLTLEDAEIALAGDPGWTRATSSALRGMRVAAVQARRGDRVVVLTLGIQSRFGVANEVRLVLELIPRYGNIVLVRAGCVIAAAKQFSPAENETRSVQIGETYTPPPLPSAVELPRVVVASIAAGTPAIDPAASDELIDGGAVHVYRDTSGHIVDAHVIPLAQHAALAHTAVPELLPVWREARGQNAAAKASSAIERRRATVLARIAKRTLATEREAAGITRQRDDAAGRDALRLAGDALYTYAHEVPAGATSFTPQAQPELTIALDPDLDVKENAQRYFARYRKAADALPHLQRRAAELTARAASLDELAFEAGRADGNSLDDVTAAIDAMEGKRAQRRPSPGKPRALLRIERPSGARIIVGRSPRENDEVTFRIARPDDLWFHARNIPGSHVVLQPPPGGTADAADLDAAANLAAAHSKARESPRVDIDYTERKYVRKQRAGAPGLVWYTNARTHVGRPDQTA